MASTAAFWSALVAFAFVSFFAGAAFVSFFAGAAFEASCFAGSAAAKLSATRHPSRAPASLIPHLVL